MRRDEQDVVNEMICGRFPFEEIEAVIDMLALSSDQRSALWMLAWAEATEGQDRQRMVAEILDAPPASLRPARTLGTAGSLVGSQGAKREVWRRRRAPSI